MKIIGLDLDGTLCPGNANSREIPDPTPEGRSLLRRLYEEGYTVYLWTCRSTYLAKAWLLKHGLIDYVAGVNESPLPADDRKLAFHAYIGDDAVSWNGDVDCVLNELSTRSFSDYGPPDTTFCSRTPPLYLQGVGIRHLDCHTEWPSLWDVQGVEKTCLLTICSHAKPYAKSFIHMSVRKHLHEAGLLAGLKYGHISSAGVVPSENGFDYPFNAYDWDNSEITDPEVRQLLFKKIAGDLQIFVDKFLPRYDRVVVYLRANSSTARAAVQELAGHTNVRFVLADVDGVLPYALHHDPDDVLVIEENLNSLVKAFQ